MWKTFVYIKYASPQITISRITPILYVLKRLFNRTKLSLFLNCFLLFLISWLTVITIKVLIYFKLLVQAIFRWLLTCLYNIYRSRIHLSWILSLGVLENCYWALYKPDIRIFSPRRFVEGCGEGASFCYCTCRHQYIYWFQGSYSSSSVFQLCR